MREGHVDHWRIEPARTGRGRCAVCRKVIAEGEQRFGQDGGKTARWFHLRCAAAGAPLVFKKFERRAAQLLSASQARPAPRVRLPQPSLQGSLEVFADSLQENDDPWGTLIALRLARKHAQASAFLLAHEVALCGHFSAHDLDWRDGVIVGASLTGAKLAPQVAALLALRTTARLEHLSLEGNLTAALEPLSAAAPASLRSLELTGPTRGLASLRLPGLEQLTLRLPHKALASVLDAGLPALRVLRLEAVNEAAPPLQFFERLLASPLLRQLGELDLASPRLLNGEALRYLLRSAERLEHLELLTVPWEDWTLGAAQRTLASRLFDARRARARAAKLRRTERPLDELAPSGG